MIGVTTKVKNILRLKYFSMFETLSPEFIVEIVQEELFALSKKTDQNQVGEKQKVSNPFNNTFMLSHSYLPSADFIRYFEAFSRLLHFVHNQASLCKLKQYNGNSFVDLCHLFCFSHFYEAEPIV